MTILSTNKIDLIKNYINNDNDPDKKVKEDIQDIWNKYFTKEANSDLMLVLEKLSSMLSQLKKISNIDFSKLTFKIENGKIVICYKNQELFSADKNSKIEEILSNYLKKKDENTYVFDEFKIQNQIEELKIRNNMGVSYVSEELFNQGFFLTLSLLNNILNSINRKATNRLLTNVNKIKKNDTQDLKSENSGNVNLTGHLPKKINDVELLYKECKGFNTFLETHFYKLINVAVETVLVTDDSSSKELNTNFKKHKYVRTLLKTLMYVLQIIEKNKYAIQMNSYNRLIKNNLLIDDVKEYISNNNAVHNASLEFFNRELTIFKRNLEGFYENHSNSIVPNNKDSDLIKNLSEIKKLLLNNIQIQSR